MKDLLTYITQNVTGNDNVEIEEVEEEGLKTYLIKAPKEIMGLLIGKEGRTIRAIRTLAKARAIIEKVRVNIQLSEA